MKADVVYNDMIGTVAADIADISTFNNDLDELADFFKIDKKRFKLVGISIFGTKSHSISFLCVDKNKSTTEKEHIVSMMLDEEYENILSLLFKRLHIVLYKRESDNKYLDLKYDEEVRYSDYQKI